MKPGRHRNRNVAIAALGAMALLAALVLAYGWASDFGRRGQVPAAHGHLEEFQAMADEHGDRTAGSPGYEAAARYVEQQLEDAGYESTRQYFTFESRDEEYETFNIVAETEAGSDENVVMLGAHLDGVPGSPAINDNASGAAALLEAAQALGEQEDINNTVRLVWWGAEEHRRSPGSRHYVQDLDENDSEALEHIVAYLNFDMVASPNPVIGVYDARDPDTGLEVPDGSKQVMDFFTDYFDSQGQPWVGTGWNFASDQVAFIREDIAVGGLFTGADEKKSARDAGLFGGTAGRPRDPNYHRSGDDLDNVDPETLAIMTDAIVHAATSLARDTSALERP